MTAIFCLLMYFIVGYQAVAAKFFIFLSVSVLFQLTSETIGCASAIVTKTATSGIIVSSTLLMVSLPTYSPFKVHELHCGACVTFLDKQQECLPAHDPPSAVDTFFSVP